MQYRTLETISQDGKNIEPGEIADFYGDQAESLLMSGAIEPIDMPFAQNIESKASIEARRAALEASKQPAFVNGTEN